MTEPLNVYQVARENLRKYIDQNCIKRVPSGSQELPNIEGNGFYEWQFYLRTAVLVPQYLHFIANHFWAIYGPRFQKRPFQVAGVEQAAMPILTAILIYGAARRIPISGFSIRKERKKYGLENVIEGKPSNLPVVIIDDLTSPSHNSFWLAIRVISQEKLSLYPTGFVLVRKQNKQDSPWIQTSIGNVMIESVFTLEDFNLGFRP